MPKILPLIFSAILPVMAFALPICHGAAPEPGGQAVPHRRMATDEYQNFLGNWDEKKQPVLCAVIRTPAQYDALFHPAATMRNKRPFAPEAQLYEKEQIVLAARVMVAPKNMEEVFKVESVVANGRELVVRYRFNPPPAGATYSVKNFLALRIPKASYQKVTFIENGKKVGEISPGT